MSFSIDDELPDEVKKACEERAKQHVVPTINVMNKPPGQAFCVIAILGPNCRQKSETACVQFLGAFPCTETANAYAKEVAKGCPTYDLFVVEMFKWAPLNVPEDKVLNSTWRNEHVKDLLEKYSMQTELSNEMFMERKRLLQAGFKGKELPLE